MKLPLDAHTAQPWRIHEIAHDFKVEDVWRLPTPGGPDDFERLVTLFSRPDSDPSENWSWPARSLWRLRWIIGGLLGWDKEKHEVGRRVATLRHRLPDDLRDGPTGPEVSGLPFSSVYLTGNEWAREMSNRTVHTVMHLGWVGDESGTFHAQMAVLVKANGRYGRAYMAAIAPFRYLIVYPQVMKGIAREWEKATTGA